MEIKFIQEQIGYEFAHPDRLQRALRAAHRSDIDRTSDDGNRGLAKLGMCAMEMTEIYRTIVVEGGTSKDTKVQDHWFKNKQKRANICCTLKIDKHLTQSVRQRHQAPSTDVLATALSAIIGAVWLDLQTQNGNFPVIIEQTYAILRRLELSLTQAENANTPLTPSSTDDELDPSLSEYLQSMEEAGDAGAHVIATGSSMWSQDCGGLAPDQAQLCDTVSITNSLHLAQGLGNFDFGTGATDDIWKCIGLPGMNEIACDPGTLTPSGGKGTTAAKRGLINASGAIEPVARMRKTQKKTSSVQADVCDESTVHQRLLGEELEKSKAFPLQNPSDLEALLYHPEVNSIGAGSPHIPRLRLLYLTIGSSQTLLGFRDMLRTARNLPGIYPHTVTTSLRPQERYAEICRLSTEEALCVLLRRYHVIQLFKTAQASLFQEHGVILQTPSTRIIGQRAMHGNPVNRSQANLTDDVLGMIMPGLANGTPLYQKTRRHVTQLRRLANILAIWTDRYGFGILALLPSGLNESETNFNDTMLLNLTEKRLKAFSELLWRHQGASLARLSRAIEPAFMALVERKLPMSRLFPIEVINRECLERLPKGCMVECLLDRSQQICM